VLLATKVSKSALIENLIPFLNADYTAIL